MRTLSEQLAAERDARDVASEDADNTTVDQEGP